MQNLLKSVFLLLILVLCGISCNNDVRHPDTFRPGVNEILMTYSVTRLDTRGETTLASESEIEHSYLLFFAKTGEFITSSYAENDINNPGYLKFDLPDKLEANTTYSIVALANADYYIPSGFDSYHSYIESFSDNPLTAEDNRLLLYSAAPITLQSASHLPMKGCSDFSFTKLSKGVKITGRLTFERLVSRIDITNAVTSGFELIGVGLCNRRDSYAPLASGNNVAGKITDILSDENESCTYVDYPTADSSEENGLQPAFYSFPSISETPESGDETTTALILKARFGADENPTYYRVNIGEFGTASELKKNHCYHITINSVKASGKATAKEAYESKEPSPIEEPEIYIESIPNTADVSHIVSIDQPTATGNGKIVIDGFAPDSFNSFIDIPFSIKVTDTSASDVKIATTLEWPLEGTISNEPYKTKYYYCPESFTEKSVVNSENKFEVPTAFTLSEDLKFYISVGAMAPDDPSIERELTITANGKAVTYDLEIRPRPVIINDVILTNNNGDIYLINDRNYQGYESYGYGSFNANITTVWNTDGTKKQAYHYCSYEPMKIPFKTSDNVNTDSNIANETYHSEMLGFKNSFSSSNIETLYKSYGQWEKINQCDLDNCESPFYTSEEIGSWGYIRSLYLKETGQKMKVSKMRMFLVSEVPAKVGDSEIPICCYFTYYNKLSNSMAGENSNSVAYLVAGTAFIKLHQKDSRPGRIRVIRCNNTTIENFEPKSNDYAGYEVSVRPAKQLTQTELDNYRNNYLGYDGGTLKLSPCKPDIRE